LDILGRRVRLVSEEDLTKLGEDAVLGIRPEYIGIFDHGCFEATIYAALPTGMETTVTVMRNGEHISAVVFGSVDYPVDTSVRFNFMGNSICLFDKESEARVGIGSLEVVS